LSAEEDPMGVVETGVVYLAIGLAVALATVLRSAAGSRRVLVGAAALLFWPFYAVLLFDPPPPKRGELETRIGEADRLLAAAVARLDGFASDILEPEVERIRRLAEPLRAMVRRLEEMDELLASPEFDRGRAEAKLAELDGLAAPDDPRTQSLRARLRNIERLSEMRAHTRIELERALLRIEEMSAEIALLKFAGRPDAELLRELKEIADGVEGLAEGLWSAA
jgi:hypothetical protein